eukprot:RCo039712
MEASGDVPFSADYLENLDDETVERLLYAASALNSQLRYDEHLMHAAALPGPATSSQSSAGARSGKPSPGPKVPSVALRKPARLPPMKTFSGSGHDSNPALGSQLRARQHRKAQEGHQLERDNLLLFRRLVNVKSSGYDAPVGPTPPRRSKRAAHKNYGPTYESSIAKPKPEWVS